MKRPELINEEIYHIILRGVGDSLIFNNDIDRFRMIFSLYEFNTRKPVEIRERRELRRRQLKANITSDGGQTSVTREKLIEIIAFCFMPNHIHLLLRQIKDRGISLFMQKVGTGYASYFNTKNSRKGHLFQGKFKAVHIKDDSQLMTVFSYIHTNPLSLLDSTWKEGGISDLNKAMSFLEKYRWSSYLDYLDQKNFPSIIDKNYIFNVFKDENNIKREIIDWIKYKSRNSLDENAYFE